MILLRIAKKLCIDGKKNYICFVIFEYANIAIILMITINEVIATLEQKLGVSVILNKNFNDLQNTIEIESTNLVAICELLQQLYFDHLACITGLHFPKENCIEVVYNLYSITQNLGLALKVKIFIIQDINDINLEKKLPNLPSLVNLWGTANWQEREVYDLFGVYFDGHPDLRRILLPADWEGYPLRKDYVEQEKYHGIPIKYEKS